VALALSVIATFASLLFISRGLNQKELALLFGGLDGQGVAEILTTLEQQGVAHEIRGNSIYVDAALRDGLRLSLAGQGLPASSGSGYELLEDLNGFATTSQMFDAAYWRAKEGELARTIAQSASFQSARVHISSGSSRPFQRQNDVSASVTVVSSGGSIASSQVRALQFLVGAAVSGLDPQNVTVIDGNGILLSGSDDLATSAVGQELAQVLQSRAERLLEARVGRGNAVVEVSVEMARETETILEQIFDPDGRVVVSTEVQENAGSSQDSRGGAVTVASNIPDGDGAQGSGSSASESSETRSLTNYEVSQTRRDVRKAPGAIRRMTVAVLVNEIADSEEGRSAGELAALEELVASAVGLDGARGDILTLRAMAFEPIPELGTEALSDQSLPPLDVMRLIQLGVLAAVVIFLSLFVVRPALLQSGQRGDTPALDNEAQDGALPDLDLDDGPQIMSAFPDMMAIEGPEMGGGMAGMGETLAGAGTEGAVSKLRQLIADREPESLQILEDWMDDTPKQERIGG